MDINKVNEVISKAKEYYSLFGNGGGGSLHIVLDDGNLEDECVRFCIRHAIKINDTKGKELGEGILKLTPEEREEVFTRYNEYCPYF